MIIDGPGKYLTVQGKLVTITGPYITRYPSPWDWVGIIESSGNRNMWNSDGAFYDELGMSDYDVVEKVQ